MHASENSILRNTTRQGLVRGMLARRRYAIARGRVVRIQALLRGFTKRSIFLKQVRHTQPMDSCGSPRVVLQPLLYPVAKGVLTTAATPALNDRKRPHCSLLRWRIWRICVESIRRYTAAAFRGTHSFLCDADKSAKAQQKRMRNSNSKANKETSCGRAGHQFRKGGATTAHVCLFSSATYLA